MNEGKARLVVVSFVALSVGFAAGWWLARQDGGAGPRGGATGAPHPVGADEHLELGSRALQAGDLTAAERHFRDATAASPQTARPRVDLAAVLMLQGRWEEAHGELESAGRLEPESPEVWFLAGMLWRDGFGDGLRARQAWQRFLALVPPDSPEAVTVRQWLSDLESAPAGP